MKRYILINKSLVDDEINPVEWRDRNTILREMRPIAGRKTSTSEAERVKMDGGCITSNKPWLWHEINNVERIRYIFIKQSLEDDEIKPRIKSYNINHRFSRRYEIQTNPKSYKTNILRERRRRSRKTSTSEAERVKMDGGCSKPNQAMTIANVERIIFEY